jgi:putative DNA primase/helicase
MDVVPLDPDNSSVIALSRAALIIDPSAPYDIVKEFVRRQYCHDTQPTLYHHNGAFYAWSGRHYPDVDELALRAELYKFLDLALRRVTNGVVPFKPTKAHVNDVFDALKAVTHLDRSNRSPTWLGQASVPADEIVCCQNGLLHLPSSQLLAHAPEFFCHNVLEFDYDPTAPPPAQWLTFLSSLWPNDRESIETLQELFGLCLTADTRYQKAFLVIGPRRSGKGTIARVLTGLIGRDNLVGPTISSLGERFGLAPLIGKKVACISDARISRRTDLDKMAEVLLSVTGEDTQTIDRKYLSAWTGRLQVRFIILTNELPEFAERSGALTSRFVVLSLTKSFLGREDPQLDQKLLAELPGILNWAIEGWKRLTDRGRFVQPATGAEVAEELEELSSPIRAFVKERCVVGPGYRVECDLLYMEWRRWNILQGRPFVGPINLFSRDLRAVVPGLEITQPRSYGKRRVFVGIALRRMGCDTDDTHDTHEI